MTVAASTLVALETQPTQDQLWTLAFLFSCDWSEKVTVHQSYNTSIANGYTDNEQRWGFVNVPYRIISAKLLVSGNSNVIKLRNLIARAAKARWLVPFYSDESIITGVSGATLTVSTTDKRYCVGARVAIVHYVNGEPTVVKVSKISSLPTNQLVTEDDLSSFIMAGDSIYPLIEAELALTNELAMTTGNILTFNLEAIESLGNFTLDPFQSIGSTPAGFATVSGKLLLNFPVDLDEENSVGVARSGDYTNQGRGKVLQVYGSRARWTYKLGYKQLDRVSAVNLIRFFEAVGGRLKSFYVVSPFNDIEPISFASTTAVVKANTPLIDWSLYTHIVAIKNDGTMEVKAISAVTLVSGNHSIAVTAWNNIPSLSTLDRLAFVHLARFDTDEMVEEWQTNTVMSTKLPCIELMNEVDITLSLNDFAAGAPS